MKQTEFINFSIEHNSFSFFLQKKEKIQKNKENSKTKENAVFSQKAIKIFRESDN